MTVIRQGQHLCGADLTPRLRKRADAAQARGDTVLVRKLLRRLTVSPRCARPALANGRCAAHGGLSCGARTESGKRRQRAGRSQMLAEREAQGLSAGCGRKAGGKNRPKEVIAQERHEKRIKREHRRVTVQARQDRRARRQERRREAVELKRGHDAFRLGEPFFAPADPIDYLEATLDDVLAAARRGEFRGTAVDDFRRLERSFVANLAGLPADRVDALWRRFDRIEEALDDGNDGARRRRARLEEAVERWRTLQRAYATTAAIVAGRDVRAQERAENPLPRQSGPHSIAPWLRRS